MLFLDGVQGDEVGLDDAALPPQVQPQPPSPVIAPAHDVADNAPPLVAAEAPAAPAQAGGVAAEAAGAAEVEEGAQDGGFRCLPSTLH